MLRGARLDGFLFFLVPFALVGGQEDGEGDVIGLFFDNLSQLPGV